MSPREKIATEILLVEDDHEYWEIARRAFGRAGIAESLHIVNSGEEALRFLRGGSSMDASGAPTRPRVVLMDLNMPGMGGIETVRAMKQDSDLRPIPVVVFSASTRPSDVRQCYDAGANSFVEKPVDFAEYVRTARILCDYWLRLAETPEQKRKSGHE